MGKLGSPMAEFDTSYRTPRHRSGMDPNTKRLAVIAGGIGAALVVMVGAWSLTGGKSGGGVPVVEADSRPLRVKPDATQQGPEIDSPTPTGKQALAPTPEAPKPEALRAAAEKAAAEKLAAEKAAADKLAAEKAAAEKAAAERTQVAAAPPPAAAPAPVQPVVSAPAARPPSQPAVLTAPAPQVQAPPTRAPAAAAPAPAPTASGGTQVQLAAVTSEQAALSEWSRLEKRMPEVLGGRRPAVVKTERDGKTFYRLRTGGFADAGQASSFCEKVRAKGGVCSVASF